MNTTLKAVAAPKTDPFESLIIRAQNGDRAALEDLVLAIHDDVSRIARRFLWHPQDVEDAVQEILVRVITGLAGFRGESKFLTWVRSIAANSLLSIRDKHRDVISFDEMADDLVEGLETNRQERHPDEHLLEEEIKIGCTQAMLMCLDRNQRLAYILGEILELDHGEASDVLQITPASFRKRLSRARNAITSFMRSWCGLVREENQCRCNLRITRAIALGRVRPDALLFTTPDSHTQHVADVRAEIAKLDEARRVAAVFRSRPEARPDESIASWLRTLLGNYSWSARPSTEEH